MTRLGKSLGECSCHNLKKVLWAFGLIQVTCFSLSFDDDALAFVVISVPSMFEKTFLPFVKRSFDTVQEVSGICDLVA